MKTSLILRRLRLPLLSAAALLVWGGPAAAQNTSNWTGTGGNGLWSNAGNWDAPPTGASGGDTDLVFTGSGNLATVNDIANPFFITNLTYSGTAATNSISGGALTFQPGTNAASITTASGTGRLLINSTVNFTSPTAININSNNGTGAELFFGGPTNNPAGNTITINTVPPGTLVMFLHKNNTGLGGTWAQLPTTLSQLGAVNAMWRTTAVTLTGISAVTTGTTTAAGFGIPDAGHNQQIGSVSGSGQFLVGTTNSPSTALVGFLGGNQTLSGSAGLAGFNFNSHIGKVGTGRLTVSNENASFNTALSSRDGGLELTGATGSLTNSVAGPGALSIYAGAYLRASNSTAPTYGGTQGRLSDTAQVRLIGGQLRYDGGATNVTLNGSTNSINEILGSLRPFPGQSVVVVNANAAQPATVNFASVTEADLVRGGQVAFVGTSLGAPSAAGVSRVNLGGTVTVINGILPWALSQVSYTSNTTAVGPSTVAPDALAILGPNGVAPLTTFTDNDFSSATLNVRLNSALAPVGAALANSLTIATGGSGSFGSTLTVTSGAIMNTAAAGSISGTGPLTTSGRFYINSSGSNVLTIGTPVQATGLAKGGSGVVTLTGPLNVGTGLVSVNSGTLNLGSVTGNPVLQVSRGATLGNVGTVGGTLRGNGTVTGNVTMAAGSLIGGTSLSNNTLVFGAAPGTLTINGNLALIGGTNGSTNTRLRFYLSSVFGGLYTQGLIVANNLDLSAVTPANPVVVEPFSVLLSEENGGGTSNPVYDFDLAEDYTWTLVDVAGSGVITGFNPAAFTVSTANFSNPTFGTFSVTTIGNDLVLSYVTAIPEPALLGLAGFGLLAFARRIRK